MKSTTKHIFGYHPIVSALTYTAKHVVCVYLQTNKQDENAQEIQKLALDKNIPIKLMARERLGEMVHHANHQGFVAEVSRAGEYNEDDLQRILNAPDINPLILILDGVQDPHNLGACLRTASAAGVHVVIAPRDRACGLTPTVYKSACGAAEVIPFIQVTNLVRTMKMLKEFNVWLYGAAEEATQDIYHTDFKGPMALVMGAEGEGLRRLTKENCDFMVKIPMTGVVPNLNVSVATGVCLFEAVRQRS